jgi:hypothetical protein
VWISAEKRAPYVPPRINIFAHEFPDRGNVLSSTTSNRVPLLLLLLLLLLGVAAVAVTRHDPSMLPLMV